MNALLKRWHIPKWLRWKWIGPASRDNGRTPVQWSAEPGAGFTTGKPWLGINANHRRINYAAQEGDPASVLGFYRALIAMRASSETLKYAPFRPRYARSQVIAYDREGTGEVWTVILNFSGKQGDLAGALRAAGVQGPCEIAVSNTGRADLAGRLEPWEAVVVRRGGDSLSP
jgi:oligo-1,6-glucosidase